MSVVCVFLSVCCPHFEDKRELLLGLARELAARRVDTTLVLAGNTVCSHIIRLRGDRAECAFWFDNLRNRATGNIVKLETEVVGSRPDLEASVDRLWGETVDKRQQLIGGLRLYEICRASIVRRLAEFPPDDGVETSYQKDALRHIIYYRDVLRRCQPRLAIYFGGHFHQDRTAFIACREAGVPSIAIETGFVPRSIYWDEQGVTGSRGMMSDMTLIHEAESRTLTSTEISFVDALMCRSLGIVPRRLANGGAERAVFRETLGLPAKSRIVLFLAQVAYDASITTDGGDFTDQSSALAAIQNALHHHPTTTIAVRLHPKSDPLREPIVQTCASLGIPVLANSVGGVVQSLYDALQAADVAITVNSQSGLQAAWLGLPVVVLGRAFYSGKGLTIDAGGRQDLLEGCIASALKTRRNIVKSRVTEYLWALRRNIIEVPDPPTLADRVLHRLTRI